MTARPIDGAEGYAFFLRHGGRVELDEINEYLRGVGMRTVQPRMLVHYRKLARHGYEAYITQNRLDIAVAGEHAWTEDMRAQYREVRRSVAAEVIDGAETRRVTVERLSAVSASVLDANPPSAGRTVVLRLRASGIERVGIVSRTDKESGRFQLAFDAYSSLPISPSDAPFAARIVFNLPDQAESVVAVSDLMLQLERSLTRIDKTDVEVVRISSLSLASPLEIELTGNTTIDVFVKVLGAFTALRLAHYQALKMKREAEGVALDNEQKRRSLQKEADRELFDAIEAEEVLESTPLLDQLEVSGLPKGTPNSMTRRQFIESLRVMILLPVEVTAEMLRRPRRRG